jgi:hypothetical protein
MFIFRSVILVDFFVYEEGKGLETIGDFNMLQEESNKLEVQIGTQPFICFQAFIFRKIRVESWI